MRDINILNMILNDFNITKLKDYISSTKIDLTHEEIKTDIELATKINSFEAKEGWICFTDTVVIIRDEKPPYALSEKNILSGELVNGNNSLHIRQSEAGKWTVSHIEKDTHDGEDCLFIKENFVAAPIEAVKNHLLAKEKVCYETFWKEDNGSFKPYISRFTGFEK